MKILKYFWLAVAGLVALGYFLQNTDRADAKIVCSDWYNDIAFDQSKIVAIPKLLEINLRDFGAYRLHKNVRNDCTWSIDAAVSATTKYGVRIYAGYKTQLTLDPASGKWTASEFSIDPTAIY